MTRPSVMPLHCIQTGQLNEYFPPISFPTTLYFWNINILKFQVFLLRRWFGRFAPSWGALRPHWGLCALMGGFAPLLTTECLTSRKCDIQKLWHPESVTSRKCDIHKVWHPENVTSRKCDIEKVWHPESVTSRKCDIQKVWHPESVTSICDIWTNGMQFYNNQYIKKLLIKDNPLSYLLSIFQHYRNVVKY
jgi:hypothetical protein